MTRSVDRTRMTTTKSIAVIAPNWLGDAVMSLPLVGMLGAADATVAVVSPASTARVYRGMPEVDELAVLPRRTFTRGVGSRARYLARTRPDAVVLLPPSLSSSIGPWLARVPFRVGYRADGRGALLSRGAFDAAQSRNEHLSVSYLRLGESALAALDIAVPGGFEPPPVRVSRREHAELDALLRDNPAACRTYLAHYRLRSDVYLLEGAQRAGTNATLQLPTEIEELLAASHQPSASSGC